MAVILLGMGIAAVIFMTLYFGYGSATADLMAIRGKEPQYVEHETRSGGSLSSTHPW